MPRNIEQDRQHFREIISGRFRLALKKFFKTGRFVQSRGKDGKLSITIPFIEQPHFAFSDGNEGILRGNGDKGDVIGKDDQGTNGAGDESSEGITVNVPLEDIIHFLQEDLYLPDLKPKPSQTYDDVKIKYNNIALAGPESLRHNRRTMLQALRRLLATGQADVLHLIPGFAHPVRLITPINSDRRYRQYREIRLPCSNAVIFFGRDGSGSMDQYRCDIVSDMCWWIDAWVRHFYERVERCYFWHDTDAQEVDADKFYNYRYGGGTLCSSCPRLMAKQLENRFPPDRWNVYCFYFSDGDNWAGDNEEFLSLLKEKLSPTACNLFASTQIMSTSPDTSLHAYLEKQLREQTVANVRLAQINGAADGQPLAVEERNEQVRRAIKKILGKQHVKGEV